MVFLHIHRAAIACIELSEDAAAGSQLVPASFFISESHLVALFSISLMCGCYISFFVEVNAKVCWCFFRGGGRGGVDGVAELLFDIGEGKAGGHCLLAVNGDSQSDAYLEVTHMSDALFEVL